MSARNMWRTMRVLLVTGLVVFVCQISHRNAVAVSIVNGGFETGDFTGWDVLGGSASVGVSLAGVGPAEGDYMARLSTATVPQPSDGQIEGFLGLNNGSLDALVPGNAIGGAAIRQTINVNAGDRITFEWNYLTQHVGPLDFAFVAIDGTPILLADSTAHTVPTGVLQWEETGYFTSTHGFSSSGPAVIGFGVLDTESGSWTSGLAIDQVLPVGLICDVDGDGDCDLDDIDRLYDGIRGGASGGPADIDGSGAVDNDDIDDWLVAAGDEHSKVYVPGDTDLDGSVLGNDFTRLAADFGSTGFRAYWRNGNFDGESRGTFLVGGSDFSLLAANFNHTSLASVPEPGTWPAVLIAAALVAGVARRKKQ